MNNYVNHFISYCYVRIFFLKYSKKCKKNCYFVIDNYPILGNYYILVCSIFIIIHVVFVTYCSQIILYDESAFLRSLTLDKNMLF